MSRRLDETLRNSPSVRVMVVFKGATARGGSAVNPLDVIPHFVHIAEGRISPGATKIEDLGALRRPGMPRHFPRLGIVVGHVTRDGLDALRAENRVQTVSPAPDYRMVMPADMQFAAIRPGVAWGVEALGADQLGLTGRGVLVGHLDSGVGRSDTLNGAVEHFAIVHRDGTVTERTPFDGGWHGTHTAATIAGRAVPDLPRVGMAPEANLASAVVFDTDPEAPQPIERLLDGMQWALEKGVRVLNMSIGLVAEPDDPAGFLDAILGLRANGVLPICAIGNDGPNHTISPGNYAKVLSVGAAKQDHEVWPPSSSDAFKRPEDPVVPDLVAPGDRISSANPDSQPGPRLIVASGTSMATAHISGLAALLFEAKPSATVDEVEQAIFSSCEEVPLPARTGRGFPNAQRARDLLLGVAGGSDGATHAAPSAPEG